MGSSGKAGGGCGARRAARLRRARGGFAPSVSAPGRNALRAVFPAAAQGRAAAEAGLLRGGACLFMLIIPTPPQDVTYFLRAG